MAHMGPDIHTGAYWEIETTQGTWCVPTEVTGAISCLHDLADYCEGDVESATLNETEDEQVLGRLSAPGYLDCTDWDLYDSRSDALVKMEVCEQYEIPEWAIIYIVNGDNSGLTPQEVEQVDSFIQREDTVDWNLVECVGEPYFTHNPEFGLACNVQEVLAKRKDA